MSKPIPFVSPLLLFPFFILLFACRKEEPSPTVIKGIVSDRKTSLPIEGAVFLLGFVTGLGSNETTKYVDFSTDTNGEFEHSEDADYDFVNGGSNVSKSGYVSNHNFNILKGKENILNITLLPTDAVLKIIVLNQSGVQSPFYFHMINPEATIESGGLTAYYFLNEKPLNLLQGEEYSQYFKLPEGRNYLYWDTKEFNLSVNASFIDTVWAYSYDTLEYKITY